MFEIFLSHSGSQKPFVVRLKDALQAAGHSPFFDVISLPKAQPFPPHILDALQQCKLGVVVLSEEFITSHWPMRELALLHQNPSAKIFPLFYDLSPHALKSQENLSRWRPKWKEIGEKHGVDTSQWEAVVGSLPSLNGEVFLSGSIESSYIDKVVKEICRIVPLSAHYNEPNVNGRMRLGEVIMSKFQTAQSACKSTSCACTIAFYGVGGAGKTTLCQLSANLYSSHYPGKSLWLEFPTDGDKKSIAEECKKLLRHCTNASDEHVLSNVTTLDEILPELDKRMSEHAVFLAIDNIYENTFNEVKRLLQVKFNKESKILITSRCRAVLKALLEGCDEATCIDAVPSMQWEEALSTLEMWCDHDLSCVPHKLLDRVLRLCLFADSYHPLALKALGKRLRMMQLGDGNIDQKEIEANISHLSLSLVDTNLETLIRINFDNIPPIRQHMFLDVVVVFMTDVFEDRPDAIQKGLRILYANEQRTKYDIDVLMHQLALDGLLDFEEVRGKRRIVVHDLYLDLAKREAVASPRFFLGGRQENSRDWSMVKRVVLLQGMGGNMEKVMKQNCPQLEVLIVDDSARQCYNGELNLADMGELRILILQFTYLEISTSRRLKGADGSEGQMVQKGRWSGRQEGRRSIDGGMHVDHGWRGCVGRLAWLQLLWCTWERAVEAVYGMDRLEVLILKDCEGPWKISSKVCNTNNFFNVEELVIYGCPRLESISDQQSMRVRKFTIRYCPHLKVIPMLYGVVQLRIKDMESLKEIQGLHDLMNLEIIQIENCPLLKAIPEIPALRGLISLKEIYISKCPRLKVILLDFRGAVQIEMITINDCKSLEEIPDLSDVVLHGTKIHISGNPHLKEIKT